MRAFHSFIVALALAVMATQSGWAQPPTPTSSIFDTSAPTPAMISLVKIDLLTRKIAAANPLYPDPHKVPIGAVIYVPTGQGVMVSYKTEPWQYGLRGCFWQIATYHLYGLRSTPADTAPPPAPVPPTPAAVTPSPVEQGTGQSVFSGIDDYLFPIWALVAIAGLTAVVAGQRRKRQLDPATHPPVVLGGLSNNPQTALRLVQAATTVHHGTNRNVISVERGNLRSNNGHKSFVAPMEHGDNVTRSKRFKVGDPCWRVRIADPSAHVGEEVVGGQMVQTEYWYHHCGNRFGEVKSGQFELPEGWGFVSTGVAAQVPVQPVALPAQTAEVAEVARNIEHAAARVEADRRVQAEINPDGVHTIELVVENGTPTPTKATITSKGHRPIKTADYRVKDGVFKITT